MLNKSTEKHQPAFEINPNFSDYHTTSYQTNQQALKYIVYHKL